MPDGESDGRAPKGQASCVSTTASTVPMHSSEAAKATLQADQEVPARKFAAMPVAFRVKATPLAAARG